MRLNLRLPAFSVAIALAMPAAGAMPAASLQLQVVSSVYSDFAFEAVLETPNTSPAVLTWQPRQVLSKYFTSDLAGKLVRDHRCRTATREICRLDFMPLWGSQDPVGATVWLEQGARVNTVSARVRQASGTRVLTFLLKLKQAQWRIKDITYEGDPASLSSKLDSKR